MIESRLDFKLGSIRQLVTALMSLPAELRPACHSLGEDEVGTPIVDAQGFANSLNDGSPGLFLRGHHSSFYIRTERKRIVCQCYLDVTPSSARKFMIEMARLEPIFGFACSPEERERRNRVVVQQGENTIESWVGRDSEKFVPGLYWLTLLSDSMLEKHGVPLSALKSVALRASRIDIEQNLLQFYETPAEWSSTENVSRLCAQWPGIFNVERVIPMLLGAKTFLELNSLLREVR